MKPENKKKLPHAGLKIFGHHSHISGKRQAKFMKRLDKQGYFDNWISYARKVLCK